MRFRSVAGVEFPEKPAGRRAFVRETTRWQAVVEGIRSVDEALPKSAYRIHSALMDVFVMAELRRREAMGEYQVGSDQLSWKDILGAEPDGAVSRA